MAFVVGLGGVLGAILRYWIGMSFAPAQPGAFPLGTFLANMIGSFGLAWLTSKMASAQRVPQWIVTGIGTGMIGSFTTFSTFSVETTHLFLGAHYKTAIFYVLISLLGGWLLAFLGYHLGRNGKVAAR